MTSNKEVKSTKRFNI